MAKPLIVRDSREKVGYWDFPEDNTFAGTIVEKVEYGDYTIKGFDNIFIDRKKNTGELATNFLAERFWDLLQNATNLKYRYIIAEFDFKDILNFPTSSHLPTKSFMNGRWRDNPMLRIKPAFIVDSIIRIGIEYDVHFILAGSKPAAERTAYYLLQKIWYLENVAKL